MTELREEKVKKIAIELPEQQVDQGEETGKLCILGWGSTYGAIKTAVKELLADGFSVANVHLRYLNPLPSNLESLLKNYDKVLVPELNKGQLVKIIRSEFLIDALPLSKMQGLPFSSVEIREEALKHLEA
jgi:2-oxoglutarate ferredoxin oxidoreductase subunit alpha